MSYLRKSNYFAWARQEICCAIQPEFTKWTSNFKSFIGLYPHSNTNSIYRINYNDKSISIFYMEKDGVANSVIINVGNRPDGIAIYDMNKDDKNDIVITNYDDSTLMILFGN